MIRISSLPLIENPGLFHASRLILLVDVLNVGDAPRSMREYIKSSHGGFVYEKQTYMPITLTGQPESLIANAEKGILFKFDKGFQNLYTLDANLDAAIWHKKLYDMTAYTNDSSIAFEKEVDFIIERYLSGYREYVQPENTLLKIPAALPMIGTKAMKGLRPVRKI
ncbi:hypothetical protein [Dyadobacter psychrotolerans]|uniref:Uncharacterized protein n=1 Tax=Dyadobacter psychrotolerans TaxID=2541721 RepID=A0A4R5DWR3_9BACT|nr:hypothetical protein [Dyadobacter psychrotolerans]TDE16860.1 hypothetical protein E0F88_11625 [Dyadobacter psychrotolerans]